MLHEKSEDILRALYKSASFAVQAIAFKQSGKYIKHHKDLLSLVSPDEQTVIETFIKYKNGLRADFEKDSQVLFVWTQKWINNQE